MSRPLSDPEALTAVLAEEARSRAGGETRSEPQGEPDPEELLDYLAGRLAPEDEERVGRRLVASPEAARALLALAELEEAAAAAGGAVPDLAVRAGWRDLWARLAAPRRRRWPPVLSLLAAASLAAAAGLGVWVWRLERDRQMPRANPVSLELMAGSRAEAEPAAVVAPGTPLLVVLAPEARCADYEALIEGPGAGERRRLGGLQRDGLGRVELLLPAAAPGRYALTLSGCSPRRPLERHLFRVARPPRAGPGGDGG
jgi:hypothetical protein